MLALLVHQRLGTLHACVSSNKADTGAEIRQGKTMQALQLHTWRILQGKQ